MIGIRPSTATRANSGLKERKRRTGQGNREWLKQVLGTENPAGWMVLLGGTSVNDFRLRVAQSHARRDLLPSFWSHAGILRRARGASDWELYEVSLQPAGGFGDVAGGNGVQTGRMSAYDDAGRYPNIACIQVRLRGPSPRAQIEKAVEAFRRQRNLVDTAALLVEWLGFVWGAGGQGNPLLKGVGLPSAAFLESVFAIAGLELTPGLASASSCPEAIWQGAKWWHEFYESEASESEGPPQGWYTIGQPAAAVVE